MIGNVVLTRIIAVIAAYLIGSVSFAYLFTRLFSGRDIRTLGSGNAGGNNVYREIGMKAAAPTALFDVGKGTLAVCLAYWLLDTPFRSPDYYVLLAGLAAIAGHMWPVYLRFKGGNGLSATIGVFAIVLPRELLIVIGLLLILKVITRNMVLSVNIALLTVPFTAWWLEDSLRFVAFSITIAVMLVINFIPTARAHISNAGNTGELADDLLRRKKT